MKAKPRELYELRAQIAKALAHPSRLLMLDALRETDMTVGELTRLVGSDQSTVSKHLSILREVGLLSVRKEGAQSYYAMKCPCVDGFFDCIESVLKQNLAEQQALLRIGSSGPGL